MAGVPFWSASNTRGPVPGTVEIEWEQEIDTSAAVPGTDMLRNTVVAVVFLVFVAPTSEAVLAQQQPGDVGYLDGIPDECEVTTILIDGFETGDLGGWTTRIP